MAGNILGKIQPCGKPRLSAYVIWPLAVGLICVCYLASSILYWNMFKGSYDDQEIFDYVRSSSNHAVASMKTMERRICSQAERLNHLRSVCDQLVRNMPKALLEPAKRTMSDEIHHILYCYMSKVGCTAFMTLIARANANRLNLMNSTQSQLPYRKVYSDDTTRELGFRKFGNSGLTDEEIRYRLDNYFTFMITRHPMERLISAYRDKITDHAYSKHSFLKRFRLPVLQYVRPELFSEAWNASESERERLLEELGKQHMPSFREFIQWIVENRILDENWLSAVDSCHPCAHKWSAILRLETMVSDKSLLLERLGTDAPEEIERMHPTANHSSFFSSLYLREWEDIPDEHEEYFLEQYREDMELFGYKWDRASKTTDCNIQTAHGVCC